jgi:hypothetical protein
MAHIIKISIDLILFDDQSNTVIDLAFFIYSIIISSYKFFTD